MMTAKTLDFPFPTPYGIQIQARDVIERNTAFTYLEMPTGTGKTIVLLTSLLTSGKQIHYYCQSHDQADIVIQEIDRINENNNTEYKVVHMAGRSKLCVAPNVMNEPLEYNRIQTCKINRVQFIRGKMTPDNESCCTDMEKMQGIPIIETAITLTVMNDMAVEKKMCPRTIMAHAVETADVIVMPYNYLANPHPSMQLENCIAIMDEAHGIDSKIIDLDTIKFDSKSIESLRTWCVKHTSVGDWAKPLSEALFEILEMFQNTIDVVEPFGKHIIYGGKAILEIAKALQNIQDDANSEFSGFSQSEFPSSLYHIQNSVMSYIALVKSKPMWKHYRILFDHNRDEIVMRIRPMTPAFALRKYIKPYDRVVLASGTLNTRQISRTLRMTGTDRVSLPSIHTGAHGVFVPTVTVGGKNVSLNTLSKNRGVPMWKRYASFINMVSQYTPNGMLLFSPSYKISEGIRAGLQRMQVKFPIFDNRQLDDYLDYMQDDQNQAIFISSYRGAGSEGVNFPNHYARSIFLCGVPRLPPTDEIKTQIQYYNGTEKGLGELWENYSAMIPVAQAFGRGVRHPKDWCVNYFLDSRFPEYTKFLPKWVRKSVDWDARKHWKLKIADTIKFVKSRVT